MQCEINAAFSYGLFFVLRFDIHLPDHQKVNKNHAKHSWLIGMFATAQTKWHFFVQFMQSLDVGSFVIVSCTSYVHDRTVLIVNADDTEKRSISIKNHFKIAMTCIAHKKLYGQQNIE